MSEPSPDERPGSAPAPGEASRLAARYHPGEDRILLSLPLDDGEPLRFWLTRRVTEGLLRTLALTSDLPAIVPKTPEPEPTAAVAPAPTGEGGAQGPAASGQVAAAPAETPKPRRSRKDPPPVLRSSSFLGANIIGLVMFKLSSDEGHFVINFETASVEPLFRCIAQAAMAADWRLTVPHLGPARSRGARLQS